MRLGLGLGLGTGHIICMKKLLELLVIVTNNLTSLTTFGPAN